MSAVPESSLRQPLPTVPDGFDVYNGCLYHHGIDLFSIAQRPLYVQGRIEMPVTPMNIRRLPTLRDNFKQLYSWFDTARSLLDFPGTLEVAYASKANPSEPVARTLLQAGAAYECSSNTDVEIVRHAATAGWLDHNRTIVSNGFKVRTYTQNLIRLRAEGFKRVLPVFDDVDEITDFAESELPFEVGVRSRTDSNAVNRFGLSDEELIFAAQQIMATSNLRLTTFHAMQTVSASRGLPYQVSLVHSLRAYARLRRLVPTLRRFNLGGGLPGRNSAMDFQDWIFQTLRAVMEVSAEEDIPVPDLIIESGRYLVQDHACKVFRVVKSKMADDGVPFYVVDGSIMSNFPDAWALGDQFTVLPINHWDRPFRPVRLAGLTCDQDDIYPTRRMTGQPLNLPADANDLMVGFFDCGAYQETLSGKGGSKHCLLPEGSELVLDEDQEGNLCYDYIPAQSSTEVLTNLGYAVAL